MAYQVTAVDSNGRTLFKGSITTMDSGFFDLWLPRDKQVVLTVTRNGKRATQKIGTYQGSKTCLTTLKLQ